MTPGAGSSPDSAVDDAKNRRRSGWPLVAFLAPLALAVMSVLVLRSHADAPAQPVDGRAIYARCQGCHGVDGRGIAGYAPTLAQSPMLGGDKDVLIQRILLGNAGRSGQWSSVMPGFAAQLDNDEIAAVAQWLVTTWGGTGQSADPISPDDVAQHRALLVTGTRP